MRKVLIITYHFPPDAEVGGLRAQKFAKYLPLYGWEPFILSVDEKYYPLKDPERSNSFNCEVFRTKVFWSPREAYLRIKAIIQSISGMAKNTRSGNGRSAGDIELMDRSVPRLKRFIFSLLWLPDDRTGWIVPALIKGINLIRRYKIDTVMTTSPPHSVQIIGLLLKKILGLRWVADFRDPWSLTREGVVSDFSYKIERWLEKKVFENADIIITATDFVRQNYLETYSALPAGKFVCIPNGVDVEDFDLVRKSRFLNDGKFTISYMGDFYLKRTPEVFLKAVSDLIEEGILLVSQLKLRFIGNVRYFGEKSLADVVSRLGLSSVTEVIHRVPYLKAIEYMIESKVLLVFSPQPFFQPTKVFEYMASGAYIIAFTPPGALSDLINQYPKGIVVRPDDMEEAKKAVMFCYDNFLKLDGDEVRKPLETEDIIRDFDRRNLTEKLSRYL